MHKKNIAIIVIVSLLVIIPILVITSNPIPADESRDTTPQQSQPSESDLIKPVIDTNNIGLERLDENPNDLIIDTLVEGVGDGVEAGDTVSVHYLGVLTDGVEFDNSYDRGDPFTFSVGAGQVIQGWDQGLLGAKVGEQRLLIVPSDLGYGDTGAGTDIPPGATLIFHVEVVGIN